MKGYKEITVVILAGGLGTRLRSVVSDRPKVMAEVSGKPFLSYLLEQLIKAGFEEIILSTGYKAEQIEDFFGDNYNGLNIIYSREDIPLGTGGAVKLASTKRVSDIIMVMNGDSYIDIDLSEFVEWFLEKNASAAMVLRKVTNTGRYGSASVDEKGRILSFEEKKETGSDGLINAGIYLLRSCLLEDIPLREFYSLENSLFPTIVDESLFGFCCEGNFIDIGVPECYATANDFFAGVYNID